MIYRKLKIMSREDKPVIAVTLGEPAGIGPEVVLQATISLE